MFLIYRILLLEQLHADAFVVKSNDDTAAVLASAKKAHTEVSDGSFDHKTM